MSKIIFSHILLHSCSLEKSKCQIRKLSFCVPGLYTCNTVYKIVLLIVFSFFKGAKEPLCSDTVACVIQQIIIYFTLQNAIFISCISNEHIRYRYTLIRVLMRNHCIFFKTAAVAQCLEHSPPKRVIMGYIRVIPKAL